MIRGICQGNHAVLVVVAGVNELEARMGMIKDRSRKMFTFSPIACIGIKYMLVATFLKGLMTAYVSQQ